MKQAWRGQTLVPGALLVALAAALVALAVGTFSTVFTASAQTGSWTVQYFQGTTPTGTPIATNTISGAFLNLNYGGGSPIPGSVPDDNWSAVYVSSQAFNQGTYDFLVGSDDGVRVSINGQVVLDRFVGRVYTEDRFSQSLVAGTYLIRIEYFEGVDQSRLTFQYTQTSGNLTPGVGFATVTPFGTPPPTLGPTPTPLPPTRTPLPPIPPGALTGTVVRATVLLVRGAPFLGAPVVGRVLRGQTYQVVGRDENARWFLLQLSGFQGWVWGFYLNVNGNEFNAPLASPYVTQGNPSALTGVVGQTNAVMRLRAVPLVGSEQIGRVPWGDIVPIIGRTGAGDWVQVVFRGTTGWLATAYIEIVEGDINSVPITG
jgi:uncharacterized protein YraI